MHTTSTFSTCDSRKTHFFLFFIPNRNLEKQQQVLLTHGDSITEIGNRLKLCAVSASQVTAGIWNEELRVFGVQFHPEVLFTHPLETWKKSIAL